MDTKLMGKITSEYTKVKHPDFKVGDMIEVHERIKEGEKERTQVFKGVVIAIKNSGVSKTFTIRKISYGIGVEKIYPLYSPNISKIKILKRAEKIKRSKLYYLRERVGKLALKVGTQIPVEGEDLETKFEEEMKEEAEDSEQKTEDSMEGGEKKTEKQRPDKQQKEKENVKKAEKNEEGKESEKKETEKSEEKEKK
jgi:large subunit ribosomal protein L19